MKNNKNFQSNKILLVEDDYFIIKTIKFILEKEGYQVLVAQDGLEAIEQLENKPDLILLDLILPQKNGFEVLEIIRKEKKIETPVLAFSNLAKSYDIDRALELGANDYLVKSELPVETIVKKIKEFLP
jgi:CheY-like chemotaxis protein